MCNGFKRITAVICVALLLANLLCGAALMTGDNGQQESPTEIPIYIEGIRVGSGIMLQGLTYVPLRAFCETLSPEVEVGWDNKTRTATVQMPGLQISVEEGGKYLIANERVLYTPFGIANIDGNLYAPIRSIAAAFNLDIHWDAEHCFIDVRLENFAPITHGDAFYNETDLYWLSRLINSEAGNQPMDGKIGVGNVVINRTLDPTCPDTIYEVIFDDQFGVQFHVTTSGAIYAEPNEESVVAAKLCLEGCDIVGASLYFVNPDIGVSGWFRDTRTYVASIGDHDFYA